MKAREHGAGMRRERTQQSARFKDGTFRNTHPTGPIPKPGMRWVVAREALFGRAVRRPPAPLPTFDPRPQWSRGTETGLRATWLGHSTVLLELDGHRVLTDPVWSERISPFGAWAPRRFQPIPVELTALPELDAIAISHDHFDHLDYPTIRGLLAIAAPFVVPLGVGSYLAAWGVPEHRIIELDWWESATIRGIRITATPAQHGSGRVGGRNRTLWASLVIESERHRVFFSGDSALTPEFADIAQRLGPFDLAMLEIGGFHEAWDVIHMGPLNALRAIELLGARRFMPVHWGTFNIALHAWDSPPETLIANARDVELVMPRIGAPCEVPRGLAVEPWWRAITGAPRESATDRLALSVD